MASEVMRLVATLERSDVDLPSDWPSVKSMAISRVHYEWSMSGLIHGADKREVLRHLLHSLRLHPAYVLRRPIQTSYILKEALRETFGGARSGS
jgi:hypothetical protein